MKTTKLSILPTLLLSVVTPSAGLASDNASYSWHPTVPPSITLWGLGGNHFIGSGQGLVPFASSGGNSILYSAIEAAGSLQKSNGYMAGVAVGYRNIITNSLLLGGYVFANYNRSPSSHNFWVVNPGIEALGSVWDFRINGYIPATRKHWSLGNETAENSGITQFEKAYGHYRYDHLFQWHEEIGSGIDAEVGRVMPIAKTHNPKVYIGGYHYFMDKTAKISGIEGRVVYPITKYISLEARNSYDKVRKNIFMGGIRLTFGGYNNNEDKDTLGIVGRLVDPIEHDFGNFASANSIAIGKAHIDDGNEYLLPGSYWYFDNAAKSNTSSGDGTYEHPFNAIDSRAYQIMTTSGAYSQNVKMYVATGQSAYGLSSMSAHRLSLLSGYSIYGRTDYFTRSATAALRPELDGGIVAFGGNNINDIQLKSQNYNFGSSGALFLNGTQAKSSVIVNINDVNINVAENNTEASGISGMNSYAIINNSQITVNAIDQSKQSTGIDLFENSAAYIGSNNYIHTTITSAAAGENHSAGIGGNSPIILEGNNNQIIADATGDESRAIGILAVGNPVIIFGNDNHIIANATGYDSRAGGIVDVGTAIISGSNNQISGSAVGVDSKALGIGEIEALDFGKTPIAQGNAQIVISGSNNKITASSAESNTIGIVNFGGALIISGNNNQVIANSARHTVDHECNSGGIVNLNDGTTKISGDKNQITVNSAYNAYGIFFDATVATPSLMVKNTIFNITTTGAGEAAGISMKTQTDATNVIIQNNQFNVSATGATAKSYGIYLPNAVTPTAVGNIAANTFNITNSDASQNAWGVYVNSKWDSTTAEWIRKHNIWTNPTSATPQQQVYTD